MILPPTVKGGASPARTSDAPPVDFSPDYLSDVSTKDAKWDAVKAVSEGIAHLYMQIRDEYPNFPELSRYGPRVMTCAQALFYEWCVSQGAGGEKWALRLKNASFCRVRHCPICQWRRSMRNHARFIQRLPAIFEEYPKSRWLFLTLTIRNCDTSELRHTLSAMGKGWKRLIQSKAWPALGFVRTTEVTRNNDDGTAHPHYHILMHTDSRYFKPGRYIDHARWAEMWRDAMRLDYLPVVDIRTVKPNRRGQPLGGAVAEVLKYGTKPSDALSSVEWLLSITLQLQKLRFIASGGSLKGILKDLEMTDKEMIVGDDEENPDDQDTGKRLVYGWQSDVQRYKRKTGA